MAGLVLLRVADELVRRGEAQPVQLAGVVGRRDRVLRLVREDEAGRIGAVSRAPPVVRPRQRQRRLLAEVERARHVGPGPARTLDVGRVGAPLIAVLGGRFRARDPGPRARVRLQELDVRAVAGHLDRARVGRLDRCGVQVRRLPHERRIRRARRVERCLLPFDVEADIIGGERAAVGRRAVPEPCQRREAEDVGLLVRHLGQRAEVGFELVGVRRDGPHQPVVHQAHHRLRLPIPCPMRVPAIDPIQPQPEPRDPARHRPRRQLRLGLDLSLRLRVFRHGLLRLLLGNLDLRLNLVLLLRNLLHGRLLLRLVIAPAADQRQPSRADAGPRRRAQQPAPAQARAAAVP